MGDKDRERLRRTTKDGGIARRGVVVGELGAAAGERGIGIWSSSCCRRGPLVLPEPEEAAAASGTLNLFF